MFHIGLLCQYKENDNILFPKRDVQAFYNIRQTNEKEWLVNKIMVYQWARNKVEFLIKWILEDFTWEPSSGCEELKVLERYVELQGVSDVQYLPCRAEHMTRHPKDHY